MSALEHFTDDTLKEDREFIFALATINLELVLEYAFGRAVYRAEER